MEIRIQLNHRDAAADVNVDLQWNVSVLKPKRGFLAGIFRDQNRINRRLRLSVDDIRVPKDIVCDRDKLFSILYKGQLYPQADFPVDVEVTSMEMPFQLIFHQAEIKDCLKPQDANPRSYPIKFTVSLLHEKKDEVIDSLSETIDVIFEPMNIKPQFVFDTDETDIDYSSSLARERVATLAAWIDENLQFTPDQLASVKLRLYKDGREVSHLVAFDAEGTSTADFRIRPGRANAVKLPVYVDFTQISNPVDDEEDFTIEASIVLSAAYSPEVKESLLEQTHFSLLKDNQGTELKVFVSQADSEPVILDGSRTFEAKPFRFVPRSRLMGELKIDLCNIATDDSNPRAGLYIKNLTLTEELLDEVKVVGEGNTLLSRFIKIDGAGVDEMKSYDGLFIPNGADAKTSIVMNFSPTAIVDLVDHRNFDFAVRAVITFDYWEDKDGTGRLDEADKKTGRIPVTWRLHLEPNPEWLCVDYGSSAIVCRYDTDILDLKRRKQAIFRGKFAADTIEQGTKFLSSDIIFHNVVSPKTSTLASQHRDPQEKVNYLDLAVCLSPTSSLIKDEMRSQLPCLKILVGNEYLPEKPAYLSFEYSRIDESGALTRTSAKAAKGESNGLLRISSIFNEAYSSLFRYFILPESADKAINKLVLTYPNTYTPAHLKVLEKIASETFPKVRRDYLRFVSESDAVAAYYLQNWNTFNPSGNMSKDETVLVYDMGAGTLDLTLFRKSTNRQGKIEVEILGKIGTGKAGNYLDFLIAEILRDKLADGTFKEFTVSTQDSPDAATHQERFDLKDKIKNNIKPNLRKGIQLEYGDQKFSSLVILEDKRFTDFLAQVTEDLITQLKTLLNMPKFKIDTVIMSGRSCRLDALQQSLKEAVRKISPDARVLAFSNKGDREKTVVVEGAMVRASLFSSPESPVIIHSRRLYASYGLVYQKLGGAYAYVELLKGAQMPTVTDTVRLTEYEGPTVTATDTSAASKFYLVQTYLSPEDTQKAFNEGNMEFISIMEEYDKSEMGDGNSLNLRLKLDYKNNVSLYVNGQASVGSAPMGVDLTSEITKRSIWPVTI